MPDVQIEDKAGCVSTYKSRVELHLSKYVWKVSTGNAQTPIIKRRVLESLRYDKGEMPTVTWDKYGGDINVIERMSKNRNEEIWREKIGAIFGEPVFRNGWMGEDAWLQDEKFYVDFGDSLQGAMVRESEKRIIEAITNGSADTGVKRVKRSIKNCKRNLKLRRGTRELAKVPPKKLELDPTKPRVRVKIRERPMIQKKFLDHCISQLLKMGFIELCSQTSWRTAPQLVPKDSEFFFRTTVDLRPANAAAKAEK